MEWAAQEPWSTGKVGMYGKSYDGVTGLLGEILQPEGLAAVVAQEPVYDMYRYLYSEGMRFLNSAATPALYDAIEMTPGSVQDDPEYLIEGSNTSGKPGCEARNWAEQQDSDHGSAYWRERDLIARASEGRTPLFLTQGFLENNTKPDGTWDFFNAVQAPKRAWFGMWDHVRGTDVDETGRLKMGRKGFNGEVMRFYDRWLRGIEPEVEDPALVIQTNDGTWRAEEQWPPADAKPVTVPLTPGEYVDDVDNKGTGDGIAVSSSTGVGVWTISPPLPHEAHLAGVPRLTLDVETEVPNANLAAAVYDIDPDGQATLVHRQGRLLPESGSYTLDLYGNDWRVLPGHRLGALVSTAHAEWWLLAAPTFSTVSVKSGSLELPFLTYTRPDEIHGKRAIRLDAYLANAPFEVPAETIEGATVASFPLPPAMVDRPADEPPPPGAPVDSTPPAATPPTGTTTTPTRPVKRRKLRISARLVKRDRGRRLVVRGSAPKGTRLKVRLLRGGKTVARKRTKAGPRGRFVARFRVRRAGRYRVIVTTQRAGRTVRVRTKVVRLRLR